MNKQTLFIITAFAIPIILLITIAAHLSHHPTAALTTLEERAKNKKGHPANLQEALEHNRNLLLCLQNMEQPRWNAIHKEFPALPANLDHARDVVKKRLEQLKKMQPDEWLAQRKQAERHASPAPAPAPSQPTYGFTPVPQQTGTQSPAPSR